MDLGALNDADQRTRDLKRAALDREGEHVDGGIRVALGVPFPFAGFEPNGQRRAFERARGRTVVVDGYFLESGGIRVSRESWSRMGERGKAGREKNQAEVRHNVPPVIGSTCPLSDG